MQKLTAAERREQRRDAIERLRGLINPSDTIYVKRMSTSRSGSSSRVIVLIIAPSYDVNPKPAIRDVSRLVAIATSYRYIEDTHEVVLNGGNVDKEFELVHSLSYVLFGHPTLDPSAGYLLTKESL